MTTALAETALTTVTPDQLELIKRTVAQGATADELNLYLYDCQRQGVHPLDKLIYFTKRKQRDGTYKYTPITSIDFMRTRASDTGEYAGSDDAVFAANERDAVGAVGAPPHSSTVTVWRLVQGQRCPFTATARWKEYKPDQNDFMWQKLPHTMLAKCAEALALRKGFPRQLAGLYAKEEMDQAGPTTNGSGYVVEAPRPPEAPMSGRPVEEPETGVARAGEISGTFNPHEHTDAAPPEGTVRIMRVDVTQTRNANIQKYLLTDQNGETYSTINRQMGALAEQLAQEGCAVRVTTKASKWGLELVSLNRAESQPPVEGSDPLLLNDDIPF